MSAAATDIAEIDATLAKGGWWLRVIDELRQVAYAKARELTQPLNAAGVSLDDRVSDIAGAFVRVSSAFRRACDLSMRLCDALRRLRLLRQGSAEAIAAAKARAAAAAEALARRERARERAEARRAANAEANSEAGETLRERAAPALGDRAFRAEAAEAIGRPLFPVLFEPAYVDLESFELRKQVESLCAALRIKPDWSRWEAGDWLPEDPDDPSAGPAPTTGPAPGEATRAAPEAPPRPPPSPPRLAAAPPVPRPPRKRQWLASVYPPPARLRVPG